MVTLTPPHKVFQWMASANFQLELDIGLLLAYPIMQILEYLHNRIKSHAFYIICPNLAIDRNDKRGH